MIERLVVHEETDFQSVDELIAYHKGCEDYAIAYSGLNDYFTLHFPATAKDRTIYRTAFEKRLVLAFLFLICLR